MRRLFFYEIKKLFSGKVVPLLLAALFLLNALLVYRGANASIDGCFSKKDVVLLYNKLDGLSAGEAEKFLALELEHLEALDVFREWAEYSHGWTPEEKEYFRDQHRDILEAYAGQEIGEQRLEILEDEFSQRRLLEYVYQQVSACASYPEFLQEIEHTADTMMATSLFGGTDSFTSRNIRKTPKAYAHLKDIVPKAEASEGILLAVGSRVTDLILLFAIFSLALYIMINERENETLLLIKPMKNGYQETIIAKIITMLVFSMLTALLFYGSDYAIAQGLLGLGDLTRPIQSIAGFLASPFRISAGTYLVLFLLVKAATAALFGALILCICTIFKNLVSACISIAGILLAEALLYQLIGIHSFLSPLRIINLISFADTSFFFRDYFNMNILGWPVRVIPICVITGIMIFAASVFGTVTAYVREKSVFGTQNPMLEKLLRLRKKSGKGRGKIRTSLLFLEGKKLFWMEYGGMLLLVFALLQWGSYRGFQAYAGADENFYQHYMSMAEGHSLPEIGALYEAELQRFSALTDAAGIAAEAYGRGEIPFEEYNERQMEAQIVQRAENGFFRAYSQYEYVNTLAQEGEEVRLFSDSAWEELFGPSGKRDDLQNAGKLAFFLILGLASVFAVEHQTNVSLLQQTAKCGRWKIITRKFLVCAFYGAIACQLAYMPRYFAVFSQYGTAGLDAPLRSLRQLEAVPFHVALWKYLVLLGLARYLATLAAIAFILFLSEKTRSRIYTILISSLCLLLPVILLLSLGRQ